MRRRASRLLHRLVRAIMDLIVAVDPRYDTWDVTLTGSAHARPWKDVQSRTEHGPLRGRTGTLVVHNHHHVAVVNNSAQ